jgi:hypothetical protein
MKTLLTMIAALGLTSCAYYQDGSANNSVNITPQYNYGGYGYGYGGYGYGGYYPAYGGYYPAYGGYYGWGGGWGWGRCGW